MKDKNFWVWGKHSVEAVVENFSEDILELIFLEESLNADDKNAEEVKALKKQALDSGVRVRTVKNLPKEYSSKRHQGVLATIKKTTAGELYDFNDALEACTEGKVYQWALLDRLEDPRNFGAILRSAAAFGLSGVIFGGRQQAPLTGVVAQTSAGQCFRVPLFELGNTNQVFKSFDKAADSGAEICIASLDMDGISLGDFADSVVQSEGAGSGVRHVLWILGSEGTGVRPGLIEKSSHKVSIPMEKSVESLNVSVASSLAFYSVYSK